MSDIEFDAFMFRMSKEKGLAASKAALARWEKPGAREAHSEAMKAGTTHKYRTEKMSRVAKARWDKPGAKEAHAEDMEMRAKENGRWEKTAE